jgi:hypothetical protein
MYNVGITVDCYGRWFRIKMNAFVLKSCLSQQGVEWKSKRTLLVSHLVAQLSTYPFKAWRVRGQKL